ncbi:MAG: AraC family transcriptional regulator [Paraglaciecola sp.]|uniref:AraC family transcriptional regulator n=1 Tax=Paraglaciecola sp. TaxID=1920173 RepID=UPI00273E3B8B|nr:AraC family transcriptional regulator [Paraglaciecola sp.]MDP5031609.1 AraC family transcriptional regulator [Paraglaciecola sp.]MDP5131260.1 AraC family transcriptional regulator [Paraglaciecola sp.]
MLDIASMMQDYVAHMHLQNLEGNSSTYLPGVHFYRASQSSVRQPLLYQSGIIIVGQGRKVIHLGDHAVQYGAGNYLVIGVPLPLECEAFVEDDQAILGLSIDVPPSLLHELVNLLYLEQGLQSNNKQVLECGLKAAKLDMAFQLSCIRLLDALKDKTASTILGPGLIREIVYQVLVGPQRHTLLGLAQYEGHYARIAKALNRVHVDYSKEISVEALASEANMSVSAFHRAFRQVTMESPLQYLKKVRLGKAKELIHVGGKRTNEVANLVGYSSPSQFSREFKRHFNQSPSSY